MDRLIHGLAADDTVRVMAAISTNTVEEVVRRHRTSPTVAAALGRTLTGAALLASTLKDFDRLTIKVDGTGPIGGITAEARPDGSVRGYVKEPLADLPPAANGKFDVGGIVGSGTLYVIRESGFDIGLHKDPYIGSVPIVSGEIGDDLAYYLARSEQIPSAVMLGVLLKNTEPFVAAAGGIIVQMMPNTPDHIITMIEDMVTHAPPVTEMISGGATADDLLSNLLGVIDHRVVDEHELRFECTCSQEKAVSMVAALGADEIASMLENDKGATMNCGFCGETYTLDEGELDGILAGI